MHLWTCPPSPRPLPNWMVMLRLLAQTWRSTMAGQAPIAWVMGSKRAQTQTVPNAGNRDTIELPFYHIN